MQLAYSRVKEHLAQSLQALYFVHGSEFLLVQETVDAIRARARASGFTERQSFSVLQANFDWGDILQAASSLSLFADKQILEVVIPSGKPGREGGLALEQLCQVVAGSDSTLLIVVIPTECDSTTKKTGWFKALNEQSAAIAVPTLTRAQLGPWIKTRLALTQPQPLQLPPGPEGERIIQFLVDQLEGNALAAHQEITKLALSYGQESPALLDFNRVERSVLHVARYDPQQLLEAMLNAQVARTHTILQGLRAEGAEIVMLTWSISETLRQLHGLCQARQQGLSIATALRNLRVWGPREKWLESASAKLKAGQAKRLLHGAWLVDGISKGILHPEWPQSPWAALTQLIQQTMLALQPATLPPSGLRPQT